MNISFDLFWLTAYNFYPSFRTHNNGCNASEQDIINRLERIEEHLHLDERLIFQSSDSPTATAHLNGTRSDSIVGPSPQYSTASSFALNTSPAGGIQPPHSPDLIFGLHLDGFSRIGTQPCPPCLRPLCSDDVEEEIEQELFCGTSLFSDQGQTDSSILCKLDLSGRRSWQLEQAFSKDVLPWLPILEQQHCASIVSRVVEGGFDSAHLETALALFVLALGAFAKESHQPEGNGDPAALPGIDYFRAACGIVDRERVYRNTILHIQCEILMSFYFLYALKPIQAFDAVHSASSKLLRILQLRTRLASDSVYQEMCHRAYWACYLVEHELQAYVAYGSRLLLQRRDQVPLPLSDYDEPGMYWFLSEIALRGIYCSSRDGVAWNAHTTYAPMLADEISAQLAEWHAGLAVPVKFPLDYPAAAIDSADGSTSVDIGVVVTTPLLDPHKVFLRAQYYVIHATLHWSFVVRLLSIPAPPATRLGVFRDSSQDSGSAATREQERERVVRSAAKAVQYAVLHIYAAESLLQQRHVMLLANITGMFCSVMLLLCTYRVPELVEIQHPMTDRAALQALRCLRNWDGEPNVRSKAKRVEALMRSKGIQIPEHNRAFS